MMSYILMLHCCTGAGSTRVGKSWNDLLPAIQDKVMAIVEHCGPFIQVGRSTAVRSQTDQIRQTDLQQNSWDIKITNYLLQHLSASLISLSDYACGLFALPLLPQLQHFDAGVRHWLVQLANLFGEEPTLAGLVSD